MLQLPWSPGFQFAGYYMAHRKGYYRDAGFEVELRHRQDGSDPVQEVLEGRAAYGVVGPRIIDAFIQGKPVVALAAVFQHSPWVIVASEQSGIRCIADLVGKRVLMARRHLGHDTLQMLVQGGVSLDDLIVILREPSDQPLMDGQADAAFGYVTFDPFELTTRGKPHRVFLPRDYGIDFYGDTLYTTSHLAEKQPRRVAAFRDASLKGWRYVLDNIEESIEIIALGYAPGSGRDRLLYEAGEVRKLVDPDFVDVGHMNAHRWLQAMTAAQQDGISKESLLRKVQSGFMFDDKRAHPSWLRMKVQSGALFAVGIALCIVLVIVLLLRTLVYRRTQELTAANLKLQQEVQDRKAAEGLITVQRNTAVAMAQSVSLRECIDSLFDNLQRLPDTDCVGLFYRNKENGTIELVAHRGVGPEFAASEAAVHPKSIVKRAIDMGTTLHIDHAELLKDADPVSMREGMKSSVLVPVRHESHIIAVLAVGSHKVPSFSSSTVLTIEAVAIQMGGALDRFRSVETLLESEQNFRMVAECAFDGVVVVGQNAELLFANASMHQLVGLSPEESGRRSFLEFLPEDLRAPLMKRYQSRLAGLPVPDRFETVVRCSDGSEVPVDVAVRTTEWKGAPAILYTFRNISERKRLEQEALSFGEWEKQSIARNLHDGLGQQLVAVGYLVDAWAQMIDTSCPKVLAAVENIQANCAKARRMLRQIVRGVMPVLETETYGSCLERLASESSEMLGIDCRFRNELDSISFSAITTIHLYHIIQEAVTNAVQHGAASRVEIAMAPMLDEGWELTVQDNGKGFDPAEILEGSGLRIMRYRADLIGGKLLLERTDQGGARIVCRSAVNRFVAQGKGIV